MKRILTVVGARPQFIKAAPVSRALASVGLDEILVHTGQHFDTAMSDVFFEELDIPRPAHNLDIHSLSHGALTGRMLEGVEALINVERPDMVLVYGDTNSTLAGVLAAAKLNIPVAHVEAGLRSFNRRMPEEQNRIVTDHLASMLFCPTEISQENLLREGIVRGVHVVGDVMYDTTLYVSEKAKTHSTILQQLDLMSKPYAVATLHRAENTDDQVQLSRVIDWLESAAAEQQIVMPLHPRTRIAFQKTRQPRGVHIVPPLGYLDMTQLVANARAVYTDSGGLQKEAYFHRVPCVTLRSETEWVETIEAGWNRLWVSEEAPLPRRDIADYGDGHAAEKIAANIARELMAC